MWEGLICMCYLFFLLRELESKYNSAPGFLVLVFGELLQDNEVGRCGSPGQL